MKKYDKLIVNYKLKLEKEYSCAMKNYEIGNTFAGARNKNAHGLINKYSNNEIVSFLIVRAVVYIMILKRCNTNDTYIKKVINTVLY